MSYEEEQMMRKLIRYCITDEDDLDEMGKDVAEDVIEKVKGKLSEMGFEKTRNPLDRIHGYNMKRNNDRIGVKKFPLTGLEFDSPCRIRRAYFVNVKVKKDDVERGPVSIQPDTSKVLDYIKNNI